MHLDEQPKTTRSRIGGVARAAATWAANPRRAVNLAEPGRAGRERCLFGSHEAGVYARGRCLARRSLAAAIFERDGRVARAGRNQRLLGAARAAGEDRS